MTRMRAPHNFHEAKTHDPESVCTKCGKQTAELCEWCGSCQVCHKGTEIEREEY